MFARSRVSFLTLSMAVVVAVGCNKRKEEAPVPLVPSVGSAASAGSAGPPGNAAAAPTLTDPQIAAIVVAANQVDIDAGQLALSRSKNAEVKKFAERMITDHGAVIKAATDLVTKLGVTPEQSDMGNDLVAGGADARAQLAKLEGDAFDRAYVDNEVAYHEAVIDALKSQLIPSASNEELKKTLVGVQPAFDAHLAHARQVQAALAGDGSAAPAHVHAP